MIVIQEIEKQVVVVKKATITIGNLITFLTGNGYVADMYIYIGTDYIHYEYNGLNGNIDVEDAMNKYIVRYAQGSRPFTIEHIDFDDDVFTVYYTTKDK